jgi:adenylosuccinate lyase
VLKDMVIDETAVARNMEIYGPFAATERVLMALVAAGGSRQDGHEWIRDASLQAWVALREGQANPLVDLLIANENIAHYLTGDEIKKLMDANAHTGTAVSRATDFAQLVREEVGV